MITIALSGPDNVGKTTQLRLLGRRLGSAGANLGPLDRHDPRWHRAVKIGLSRWWFSDASVEEVADTLACSYLARRQARTLPSIVRLVDRGLPMLEATVVSTVAVREGLGHDAAIARAVALLAPYGDDLAAAEADETGVLLLHDPDPGRGAERALARAAATTSIYRAYQHALHVHLSHQITAGRYPQVIVAGDRSIIEIQDELRAVLRHECPLVPAPCLSGTRIFALGGMSESGKSTAGEHLRRQHGFARLKIGYLLDTAAARHGVPDPHAVPTVEAAELLVDALEDYATAHQFCRAISIESLHSDTLAGQLHKLLGRRLSTIYLHTDRAVRQARGVAGPTDVDQRDVVKQARGADRIRDLADVVLDNNGSTVALYHALDRLAVGALWPHRAPRRTGVSAMNLPRNLTGYLTTLLDRLTAGSPPIASMLAVTGSAARGTYQDGWSDLDLLVVAEADHLEDLRRDLVALAGLLDGVKLGITVVSAAELQAGLLTPRLRYVVGSIAAGDLPVLWAAPDLRLPFPDPNNATSNLTDGIAAAVEIRRQILRAAHDHRALFKLTAVLAKTALLADGVDRPNDRDALAAFASLPGTPDHTAEIAGKAQHDSDACARLARLVLDWWLATAAPPEVSR